MSAQGEQARLAPFLRTVQRSAQLCLPESCCAEKRGLASVGFISRATGLDSARAEDPVWKSEARPSSARCPGLPELSEKPVCGRGALPQSST